MRLPPQIPTTLFKRSKFWEKVEGGGGRGESSLLSGFQNGSPVANLYSLERGGGEALRVRCFTHEQKCMITTGVMVRPVHWESGKSMRERGWGNGKSDKLIPLLPNKYSTNKFSFYFSTFNDTVYFFLWMAYENRRLLSLVFLFFRNSI